jgi:hypothetical protein
MTIAIRANGNAQPLPQHEEHHEMNEHQIVDQDSRQSSTPRLTRLIFRNGALVSRSRSIRAVPRHISPLDSQPRQTASECRSTSRSSAAA